MGNKEEKNNTVPNGSMEITGRRHKSARPGRISYVPISDEDLAPYEPPVRKKHKGLKITGIAVAMVIVSAGAAYAGMSYYYSDKFFEGTSINGIDCSGKTAYEAEQKLAKTVENYSIEVDSRNLDPQTISGDQIGYSYVSDGSVLKLLKDQKPYEWIRGFFETKNYMVQEETFFSREKLEEQVREFSPRLVAVWDENAAQELAQKIQDTDTKVVAGMDGLLELAAMPDTEILVTAIVGMLGIRPTIEAIRAGKDIALANKETLVTAGHLIIPMAKEYGVKILPVDSEHSAIFQSLNGEHKDEVHKLLITASGGPFRGKTRKDLELVTLEDTLKHPNWVMGQKITVDSATLVNKGLEVMEARWLFDVSLDQIQVVVQPQSVIHSMVEFKDGGIIAQLGTPDMRLPIQYALYYPHRRYLNGDRLDFAKLGQITFEEPDMDTFLGLPMAIQAAKAGGSMPTVFNAANELAVSKFLHKKIRFLDIYDIIGQSMERHKVIENPGLEEILETESDTYQWIESRW